MRKLVYIFLLSSTLAGCVSVPKDAFILGPDVLAKRQLQTRQFETTDEKKILLSCSGVLQDLGFTLDETESLLGLIVASKDRDATDTGQAVLAMTLDILSAMGGSYGNNYQQIDSVQKIRASVVCNSSLDKSKIIVRVIFQRVVWNKMGAVSKLETINDPTLYQGFFEHLSKAVFLEGQQI